MTTIGDDEMRAVLADARQYSAVLLKVTSQRDGPDAEAVVWEHVRRNLQLRADGRLAIVCPIGDDSGLAGIGIFDASVDEAARLMDEDPGVQAGIFTYEVHPVRGFPGDTLPA